MVVTTVDINFIGQWQEKRQNMEDFSPTWRLEGHTSDLHSIVMI